LEKEDARQSNEGMKQGKEQDEKAKNKFEWGATARIRQRNAAAGAIQDGEESDSDELEELLEM